MLTIDDLLGEADMLGVHIEECILEPGLMGFYYDADRTIYLDETINRRQYRCTLCHEIVHARYRDRGCNLRAHRKEEMRARRETARLLISPSEYASVEEIYEGDAWRMACELDVTMLVLDDYRRMLHDSITI